MKFWKLDILSYNIVILYDLSYMWSKEIELWNFLEFNLPDTKYCDLYKYI